MNAQDTSATNLDDVSNWVFDLDNTLYPRSCNLFAQIDKLITSYVMNVTGLGHVPARKLQKDYYRDHGTTLNGLMDVYGVDPEHYLSRVHAIDYSPVSADPDLVDLIENLPGRKFIFTNADTAHAEAVLERLGARDLFDGMFDIRAAGFTPKPERPAYEAFLASFNISPQKAAMFDDLEKNLMVPHLMGMNTVHVVASENFAHDQVDNWELSRVDGAQHIHHVTADLVTFLRAL
ncbi:Pyridoxal-5'-phosphate phosphatase, Alphaproteobacterial type [hydrothermal vent metagenome]|uniref:Pyridoxal-5'-phosphate phosphatase, Alphaproteobacterial type n=1 Tax=hydrothermal vent metagenome TaxID=652676 RepID=A0A3B0TX31_9ZZZZ